LTAWLTAFQKRLCNLLQEGVPLVERPFAELARSVGSDEKQVLTEVRALAAEGVIRRIGAIVNYRALGKTGTLVAAEVGEDLLAEIVEAVNSLEGVSHNYLRNHQRFNLWFTLIGDSEREIAAELAKLSARFGVGFLSLPVVRIFKLDVRFNAEGDNELTQDVAEVPKTEPVVLDEIEKQVLSMLERRMEVVERPFDFLCEGDLKLEDALKVVERLIGKGVIRRIAAVVDHRKLGFVANVMFVCRVAQNRIVKVGEKLARFGVVSHCYQRSTVDGWPYNLYAMMHARNMGQVQHVIDKFVAAEGIESFELLPTETELKKRPM